ncbi:MAG: PIG-L family deacetylase [Chloroflexi bacterium]|nr:PIG-L family deacetylase [Chloroflexota bacterium]
MKTLLAILAHPDDESFGIGGTLAKYAASGVAVHYLCGTRGESGTVDVDRLHGFDDIAALRTAELTCAAKELGLAGVHFLGYRDSGMAGSVDNALSGTLFGAPLDEVAERIAVHVDALRPDVIVTHDQFGGYGHPDHIKLHQATLRMYEHKYGVMIDVSQWNGSTRPPHLHVNVAGAAAAPALYFTTIPKGLVRFGVRLLPLFRQNPRRFGRNGDIDLVQISSWEVPATMVVDTRQFVMHKERASACHASQQAPAQASPIVRWMFRRGAGKEHFSRIYPPPSADEVRRVRVSDLL